MWNTGVHRGFWRPRSAPAGGQGRGSSATTVASLTRRGEGGGLSKLRFLSKAPADTHLPYKDKECQTRTKGSECVKQVLGVHNLTVTVVGLGGGKHRHAHSRRKIDLAGLRKWTLHKCSCSWDEPQTDYRCPVIFPRGLSSVCQGRPQPMEGKCFLFYSFMWRRSTMVAAETSSLSPSSPFYAVTHWHSIMSLFESSPN